jgi:hypothetical protein
MSIKTSYVHRIINRKEIKKAKYNPRKMNSQELEKLTTSLEEFGLCEPLVFNERTGTLVGGHQRLSILDRDNGSKDYEIGVAVVNCDLQTEQRLNVWLNQSSAQGSWDNNLLNQMKLDLNAKFEDFGFPQDEVDYLDRLFAPHDENVSKILDIANNIKKAKNEEQIQFNEAAFVSPDILDSLQRDKIEKTGAHDRLDTEREMITENQVSKFGNPRLLILFSSVDAKIHFCENLDIDFNNDTWEI